MAKLVLEVLLKARTHNWNKNTTMIALVDAFIKDAEDNVFGWAADYRAPGGACKRALKRLIAEKSAAIKKRATWWRVGEVEQGGGCGSVMRAYPFGLIFVDNPVKARQWAVEHSRLTHQAPIALAACAAFAEGIAWILHGKDVDFVVQKMIAAADIYDHDTAQKIEQACAYAKQAGEQLNAFKGDVSCALANATFRKFHDNVFTTFQGWAAHDAIAAAVYIFTLVPDDIMAALYLGVHTPGDSDSIASMAGALVGARVGIRKIPVNLVNRVEDSATLKKMALDNKAVWIEGKLS